MTLHYVCMVLLLLDRILDAFETTYERILNWMNSVLAHAGCKDVKALLVSPKTLVGEGAVDGELLNRYHREVHGHSAMKLRWKELFKLHLRQESCDDELAKLKKTIVKTMGAEYTTNPNRNPWLAFLDIIREKKQYILMHPKEGIIECSDLWSEVRKPCHLDDLSEFYRMLKFYHANGEIYYDDVDPVLCRYVVVNPQYPVDAVRLLMNNKSTFERQNRSEMLREEFSKKGIIHEIVLRKVLDPILDKGGHLIRLLVSLDVLLPVNGRGTGEHNQYVVPFLLPCSPPEQSKSKLRSPDCVAAFDFGSFCPETVFLHLLTQSLSLSYKTTEQHGLVIQEKNLRFNRDYGSFYFSDAIHFSLHLCMRQSCSNQVLVRVKKLASDDPAGDIYEFLHQLDEMMRRICFRHSDSLEYQLKVLCNCCMDSSFDVSGSALDLDWHVVVDNSRNSPPDRNRFPARDQPFFCRDTGVFYLKGTHHQLDEKLSQMSHLIPPNMESFFFDVYISSCGEDHLFVLEYLLPILENISVESYKGSSCGQSERLSFVVNEYQHSNSDCCKDYSPFVVNVSKIQISHCVIAVISQEYLKSAHWTEEFVIAKRLDKPIIPLIIESNCCLPLDLTLINPLFYPENGRLPRQQFYTQITKSVKSFTKRQPRDQKFSLLNHLIRDRPDIAPSVFSSAA